MNKKIISAVFGVTLISSFGKILGLIRETCLASYYGAGSDSDAFKIAFCIPDIFIAIFSAAIAQVFIPVYSEMLKGGESQKAKKFLNNIFSLLIIVSFIIVLLGIFMGRELVDFIAPGFDVATKRYATDLAVIIFPGAFFMILANLVSSYLQVHGRFIASSLTWYSYNICIIFSLVFFHGFGIKAAAVGALLGLTGMLLIQLPSLAKQGFRYRPMLDFKDDGLRTISLLVLPVIISSAFNQIYNIINRMLASGMDNGSISAMDYAYKVNSIIYAVLILSVVTVLYPFLANKSDCIQEFTISLVKVIRSASMISLPVVFLLFILRVPIVQVLFERGAFNVSDTQMTSGALGFLSFGLIGITYREILNRAFYALKDTRTPMVNGIIAIGLNIALNLILVRPMGINGLALGTSIASLLSACMLLIRLNRKLGDIHASLILEGLLKSLVAATAMGLTVVFAEKFMLDILHFEGNTFLRAANIMLAGSAGGLVYIGALVALKVNEVTQGLALVTKKMQNIFPFYAIHMRKSG